MKKPIFFCAIALVSTTMFTHQIRAGDPILELDPSTNFTTGDDWTLGWSFFTNESIIVDELGWYDSFGDGLTESHEVGLWNSTGTLLASTVVTNADPLVDWFRYSDIPNLLLEKGEVYIVAGRSGTEDYTFEPFSLTIAPSVSYIEDRYILDPGNLTFPTKSTGELGWWGASFTTTAVPEPTSAGLLTIMAMGVLRRRK